MWFQRLVTKLCLMLCDHKDCSLPGSSVRGISQARILSGLSCPSGIFLTQGLNLCLLLGTLPLSHQGSPRGYFSSVQFSSVAQSCPTLCDPMNRSTPGLPSHPLYRCVFYCFQSWYMSNGSLSSDLCLEFIYIHRTLFLQLVTKMEF